VNHKKVQQLIAQKRKTITDRQFFSSRLLAGHFEDLTAAQTRRYGNTRRVRVRTVWEPKNNNLAVTDNGLIWINAGHPIVTANKTRTERYDIVCGLFAHELGHVLYTDFLVAQSYALYLQGGRWYPEEPLLRDRNDRMNADDLWTYANSDSKRMNALMRLAHYISNILEDGYIESKMLNRYPGVLGYSLETLREQMFEMQRTLTQIIEAEEETELIWMSITQLMLSYVKFGELKYGEEPLTDKRVQVIFSLLPELDRALTESSAKDRYDVVNTIMVRCWHYIKEFLEYCEKLADDAEESEDGEGVGGVLGGLLSALAGSSGEAKGETAPVDEKKDSTPTPASMASKRTETAKKATVAKSSEDEKNDEDELGENGSSDASDEDESENKPGMSNGVDNSDTSETVSGNKNSTGSIESGSGVGEQPPYQEVSDSEGGRIPLTQTDNLYAPTGGEISHDNEYTGSGYRSSAADIDRLLENMTEKAVTKQLEKQRASELNDLANALSYGDIHEGVDKVVHRISEVEDEIKEQYHSISKPLLQISKQLQRSVSQQLKDKRRGGKQTGLLMGRRLNAHALPRNDGRVFYKTALPNEAPELVLGLLLDESGSMCSGERATYARATAIILYDFCRSLGIPVMVYGHTTGFSGGHSIDLYSYAEFDDIDGDDKYRMMDISARSGNRDGAALRYVAEQLSKRREEVKMLIIVSDGQPADSGYGGTAAEEDLRGVKHEYVKKGILFVAAAIGDDKENIERIYGDSFLDITDLNKLPVALTNVVKRYIRV
jgi:cobalamin biosynthesis protein CobT